MRLLMVNGFGGDRRSHIIYKEWIILEVSIMQVLTGCKKFRMSEKQMELC